jgi:hypothetical protein
MVLVGDEAQVEAQFGAFRDSVNLDAICVHGLHQMYHRLKNHFRHTRWNLMTCIRWNLVSIRLEIVLASVQDRYTVCITRTIGLEIVLDAPDGTPM